MLALTSGILQPAALILQLQAADTLMINPTTQIKEKTYRKQQNQKVNTALDNSPQRQAMGSQ